LAYNAGAGHPFFFIVSLRLVFTLFRLHYPMNGQFPEEKAKHIAPIVLAEYTICSYYFIILSTKKWFLMICKTVA
jgi:hypothetical protein